MSPCCPSSVHRPVSTCWHEHNCGGGLLRWRRSQEGGFSQGGPEVGLRAHAGYFTGQDAEGHGEKTPRGQVLGGAEGRGGETAGSPVRQLRGGLCVTVAESASPHSSGRSSSRDWTQDDEQEAGLCEAKATSSPGKMLRCSLRCGEQTRWQWGSCALRSDESVQLNRYDWLNAAARTLSSVRGAVFDCWHGNYQMSICAAAVCSNMSRRLTLLPTSEIFIRLFYLIMVWLLGKCI